MLESVRGEVCAGSSGAIDSSARQLLVGDLEADAGDLFALAEVIGVEEVVPQGGVAKKATAAECLACGQDRGAGDDLHKAIARVVALLELDLVAVGGGVLDAPADTLGRERGLLDLVRDPERDLLLKPALDDRALAGLGGQRHGCGGEEQSGEGSDVELE